MRIKYFVLFLQVGKWHSLHIDELRPEENLPSVHQLYNNTPANVLQGRCSFEQPSGVASTDTQIRPLNFELPHSVNSSVVRESQQQEEMEFTENTVDHEDLDQPMVDVDSIVLEEVPQEKELSQEKEVLQENEVLQVEITSMEVDQANTRLPAYFQDLILRCIQSAAALVKDDVQDSKRSTTRIEILLHFLENRNYESNSFLIKVFGFLCVCVGGLCIK